MEAKIERHKNPRIERSVNVGKVREDNEAKEAYKQIGEPEKGNSTTDYAQLVSNYFSE